MLKGFRDFLLRGNVIELAVAVVMATQFNKIIESIVGNIINPAIAQVGGEADLSGITAGDFKIGNVLNDVIAFLSVAIAVYFFIVIPYNTLNERRRRGEAAEGTSPPEDTQLLREIRDALVRR